MPEFASFTVLETPEGRAALTRYFDQHRQAADETGMGFMLDTATWRASPDWGRALGMAPDEILAVTSEVVRFAQGLRDDWTTEQPIVIDGVCGPQGDGYNLDHFDGVVHTDALRLSRVGGIRANVSRRSHAELDTAEEPDEGNPGELAMQYRELTALLPNLSLIVEDANEAARPLYRGRDRGDATDCRWRLGAVGGQILPYTAPQRATGAE